MQYQDVNSFFLSEYGIPSIRRTFGISYTKFKSGNIPGWKIAKNLAKSGLLSDEGFKYASKAAPSTQAEWEKLASIENIPLAGFTTPYVSDFLDALPRRARLSEITYDQDFTNTLVKVLECYAINTPGKSTVYPLLDGPPGASKSIVVMVAAALLNLPVYTVTGADGASDEIKISLLGGDNANADTLIGLVKKYIYQGWLKNPLSVKMAAIALEEHKHIDAIPDDQLHEIARSENIRENITCYTPGSYQLASLHGGILFLDEINGFKGVTTVLTEILENYTVDQHPNFFIIGALNPAGEKHDRDPLPPEIRSRMSTIYVKAPSDQSYYNMLQYLFTGKQPVIDLPNGVRGSVSPSITGFSILPREPGLLSRALMPDSLNQFLKHFAKAHKHIETKYEEGPLNPNVSADPATMETTSVDRRMLVRGINSIETFLSLSQESGLEYGESSFEEYSKRELNLSKEDIAAAISRMFERIYLDSFNFSINEEVETDQKNSKIKYSSASELVKSLLEFHNLTYPKLLKYLKTSQDERILKEQWTKVATKYSIKSAKDINELISQAQDLDLSPNSNEFTILNPKDAKPSIIYLPYLKNKDSFKTYFDSHYPQLNLEGQSASSFSQIVDLRVKMMFNKSSKTQTSRFLYKDEFKALKDFIISQREYDLNAIYFSILCDPDHSINDSLFLVMTIPTFCLNDEYAEAINKSSKFSQPLITLVNRLKDKGKYPLEGSFNLFINRYFTDKNGDEPLNLKKVSKIIPLDLTVKL